MRTTLIVTIVAAIAGLCICSASMMYLNESIGALEAMRLEAIEQTRTGDIDGAIATIEALESRWNESKYILESICSHNDVHEIKAGIKGMRVYLECNYIDEFFHSSALLGMAFEHIQNIESVSFENLY